jgi:hypothetical protein
VVVRVVHGRLKRRLSLHTQKYAHMRNSHIHAILVPYEPCRSLALPLAAVDPVGWQISAPPTELPQVEHLSEPDLSTRASLTTSRLKPACRWTLSAEDILAQSILSLNGKNENPAGVAVGGVGRP